MKSETNNEVGSAEIILEPIKTRKFVENLCQIKISEENYFDRRSQKQFDETFCQIKPVKKLQVKIGPSSPWNVQILLKLQSGDVLPRKSVRRFLAKNSFALSISFATFWWTFVVCLIVAN